MGGSHSACDNIYFLFVWLPECWYSIFHQCLAGTHCILHSRI